MVQILSYTDYGKAATDKINAAILALNILLHDPSANTDLGNLLAGLLGAPFIAANGTVAFTGDQSLGNHRLINLAAGVGGADAATVAQVTAILAPLAGQIAALAAQISAGTNDDIITLDPNFARAWTDGSGNAALGVGIDGQVYAGGVLRPLAAYTKGASGARDVFVGSDTIGEINLSAGEFPDHIIAGVDSGTITYFGLPGDGTLVKRLTNTTSVNTFSPSITTVFGIPIHGQSNTVGTNNYKVLTTTPLRPGQALMFNAGTKTLANLQDISQVNTLLSDDNIARLVDMYEQAQDSVSLAYGETTCSYLANGFLSRAPNSTGLIGHIHGIGGEPIAALTKGTVPYANLIKAVRRANFLTRVSGRRYAVPYVQWIQGESDSTRSAAAYLADLVTLQGALDADIKKITGQTMTVKLSMDGMSLCPGSGVPLAMLTAATTLPSKFILTGPRYFLPYVDALHHTAIGDAWLGNFEGKAIGIDQFTGPWLPLYMKTAVISGTTITSKWNIPQGGVGLTFDTSAVSDPTGGNYGLRFLDNAPGTPDNASVVLMNPTITRPQITAPDTITCVLTGTPTGPNPRLEVAQYTDYAGAVNGQVVPAPQAGPTVSPRACIRDQSPDTIIITDKSVPTTYTRSMVNWACHSSVPLTTGS